MVKCLRTGNKSPFCVNNLSNEKSISKLLLRNTCVRVIKTEVKQANVTKLQLRVAAKYTIVPNSLGKMHEEGNEHLDTNNY